MGNASRMLPKLPTSLFENLETLAQAECTSMENLLVIAVAEKIARAEHAAWLADQRTRIVAVTGTRREGIVPAPKHEKEEVERQQLVDIFEGAPVFLAVLSGPKHIFDAFNQSYLELVGDRKLIGKPIVSALPELTDTVWIDRSNRVLCTGEPLVQRGAPVKLARAEGKPIEEKYVDNAYKARCAADGTISGITVLGVETSLVQRALGSTGSGFGATGEDAMFGSHVRNAAKK